MASIDQKKWDDRYSKDEGVKGPSSFLEQVFRTYSSRMPVGKAFDIATGKGRNALFLAEKGFSVDAVDISEVALEKARKQAKETGLSIDFRKADLDHCDLPEAQYDLILNFNFLQRSLVPKIKKALKPGGHVIFESFLIDQRVSGHPKNPAYFLGHNELLDLFRDFRVLYYREGRFGKEGKETYRAGLFGQKGN